MGYVDEMLKGFVEILKKTYKIFLRNGKLIPFITLLFLLIESIIFLISFFSIKPLVTRMVKSYFISLVLGNPNDPSELTKLVTVLKDDARVLAGLEWIFLILSSFTSLLFSVAAILASSATLAAKSLTFKDLLPRVWKPWRRVFVTFFYVALLEVGFIFTASLFMLSLALTLGVDLGKTYSHITLYSIASIFYCYLSIVWSLAIVVSVMEEKCGIEALGKARQLIRGLKLLGFSMNLLFGIIHFVLFKVFVTMNKVKSEAAWISNLMFYLDLVHLVNMFVVVAYTVLYHECKNSHGEDIEMQESIEYTKVPATTPLILNADLP